MKTMFGDDIDLQELYSVHQTQMDDMWAQTPFMLCKHSLVFCYGW